MWTAIAYVSSGLTLSAFVAAIAAWVYRRRLAAEAELISLTPESDRARLVMARYGVLFDVNTERLTKAKQAAAIKQQIEAAASKYRTTALVVVIIAILAAAIAAYAIYRAPSDRPVTFHVVSNEKTVEKDFSLDLFLNGMPEIEDIEGHDGMLTRQFPTYVERFENIRLNINGYTLTSKPPFLVDEHGNVRLKVQIEPVALTDDAYPDHRKTIRPCQDIENLIKRRTSPNGNRDRLVAFEYENATTQDMHLFLYDWDREINPPELPFFIKAAPPWIALELPAKPEPRLFDRLTEFSKGAGYFGFCVIPTADLDKIRHGNHEYHFDCRNLFATDRTKVTVEETGDPQHPYKLTFSAD